MGRVYVGLGRKVGDKEGNLGRGMYKVEERIGKEVWVWCFYERGGWGFK